jgi:hypothetical protein
MARYPIKDGRKSRGSIVVHQGDGPHRDDVCYLLRPQGRGYRVVQKRCDTSYGNSALDKMATAFRR